MVLSDHPLAKILNKQVRTLAVALAGAVGDDGLSRGRHSDKRVLVAFVIDLVALDALLLLADEAQISSSSRRPARTPTIMRSWSSAQSPPAALAKAHDGIAVNACNT